MSETDYSFEPEVNDVLIEVDELVENSDIDIGEYDSSEEDSVTGSLGGLQFDVINSDLPTVYTTIDDVTPADYTCGTPGELPTPSTALVDADLPLNKIITVVTTNVEQIVEVNEDLIQFISDNNARVYAVLNDGTRVQCELSDVFDPEKAHAQVFVNQGLIIANSLKQHFWYDSNGAHVTDDEQDDWNEEYNKTGHGDLANPSLNRPWHNILINSYGLLIRKGLIWLSQHSVGSVLFYDGTGNTLNNVVAGFSTDGVQIGKLTEKHMIIDDDGFTAYDENGDIAPITAYLNGSYIEDSTITGSKIADSTIENSNIKDGTITGGKIIGSTLTDIPQAAIVNLSADYAHVTDLTAATGRITTLETNTADIATLKANSAKVANLTAQQLEAANAYIASLTAGNVTANDIIADTGKIHNLTAQQLSAAVGYIADLTAGNITTTDLIADHGTIGSLDSNYAQINMANVNNAWIANGTVKDGAITNAMINSVSANKLTAGTIDASNITVTNLNADNITTGTINGQRIGTGSLSLDKLSEDVYTESEVDDLLATMQSEIDGAIETWTGTAVPTLNNAPASGWSTNSDKDKHVGDVYFVVNSQSQQNGYNYRFTKSGNTYSWQLIKDTDITNALSRLSTAEGKITTFDSDITTLKTDTGTLKTKTQSLETSLGDKVDVTTFNDLEDTVDSHSQTIAQHSTAITNKADNSTVTSVTNRVSKNEQDISGINTTISELSTTVESKADGSTVETVSNRLNTVSNTVDGHTQSITSINNTLETKADSSTVSSLTTKVNNVSDTVDGHTQTIGSVQTTQTQMQGKLDKTIVETIQLWYSKSSTDAPGKPTAQVTSTSTAGNAWRTVVPAYNASYPNYFYCYQWKYTDGTYGWSSVTRDIAMGESQERARTAITNAAAADTKAGNAASAAATAQSTANTAASDASTAKTDAASAVSTANSAATDASTALSTANTANTNASNAVSTANTANTNASNAVSTANTAATDASTAKTNASTAVSTANTAKATADKNVKSTLQLWYTKANDTAPSKPTSKVTSNSVSGNAWRVVVPTYSASYPYYFYCYQYELADGTYTWSDVVYDRATTENQSNSRSAVANVSTLTTKTNTISNTVDGHTSQLSSITNTQTSIQGSAVKSTVQLWFTKANTTAPNKPTAHITTDNASTANVWNLAVPTYNASYPNYFYCYEYEYLNGTYGWSAVTRDIATGEAQSTARTAASDASTAKTNAATAVSTANTANTNASNAVSTASTANTNASNAVSTANTAASDASTAKTNAATAVSTANTASTNASNAVTTANTAKSTADTAKATADKNVKETILLWYSKANSTAPSKPTSAITSTSTSGNAWSVVVPTYSASYPYYFYCYQYKLADGTYAWSSVVYDQATTEAQSTARAASSSLATYITSNDAAIQSLQNQVDGQIEAWYYSVDPTTSNVPASDWTTDALKARHEGDLYYNVTSGHSWRWLKNGSTYSWQQIPDSDAAAALAAAQNAQNTANNKRRIFTATPTVPYDKGDLWVNGSVVKYATTARSSGNYTASDWSTTATDDTAANAAQATADKNLRESQQLWFTKANSTAPGKPTAKVTSTATTGNAWTTRVPTYNDSYKYYFYCMQYIAADGTVTWSDVIYDQATTEAQSVARAASADLTEFHQEYATFKQTTQQFESTVGETYATKTEIAESTKQYDSDTEAPLVVGDNAATAPLRSYEGAGHAEQFTTTGKNLLENTASSTTKNGVTFTVNADGSVTCSGTATSNADLVLAGIGVLSISANTQYTLSGAPSYSGCSLRVSDNKTQAYSDTGQGAVFSYADTSEAYIYIRIGNDTVISTPITFYPQLELGSTATDYEPYTGGAPSPSPDYPQEIKVVRGRNLWDGTASVTLSAANSIIPSTGFDATAGESYTFSFNASEFTPSQSTQVALYFRNSSNTELTHKTITARIGLNSITLVAPSGSAKIHVYANFACMISNIQLELGSHATPYVPYGHVGLEAQGRNLFDPSHLLEASGWTVSNGVYTGLNAALHTLFSLGYPLPPLVDSRYTLSFDFDYDGDAGVALVVTFTYANGSVIQNYINAKNSHQVFMSSAEKTLSEIHISYGTTRVIRLSNIQLEAGSVATAYEPYYHTTTPIPLPSRGWVAGLSDGTSDVLTLDSSGKVEWELPVGHESYSGTDMVNISGSRYGVPIKSARAYLAWVMPKLCTVAPQIKVASNNNYVYFDDGLGEQLSTFTGAFDLYYPLATPTIEDCGYVDMPQVSEGCTISIPELEDSGISWWCKASESMANVTTAIEKRVTTAETSITQTKEQILLKANSSDVYTKTQTDGLISTEVTNRNAAIKTSADAINLSVSQNYTTKTDFNNMKIGGRNLFSWPVSGTKWKDEAHTLDNYQNRGSFTQFTDALQFDPLETIGEKYTISFDVRSPNGPTSVILYNQNGKPSAFYFYRNVATDVGDEWVHCECTITNVANESGNAACNRRIEIYAPHAMGVLVRKIKVEKGNKATDWTPAPEDVEDYTDTQVNAAKAAIKVTTDSITTEVAKKTDKAAIISTINQTAETVKIQASKVEIDGTAIFNNSNFQTQLNNQGYATTTQVATAKSEAISAAASDATTKANNAKTAAISTASSDATSKANAAQTAAINAAASDATTKANAAQSAAISAANSATDTKLQNYTNTTNMNSAIATAKSEAISAAASDATTKANNAKTAAISTVQQQLTNQLGTTEAPYREVEWVESNGRQFIYLDWKPNISNFGFEIDFITKNKFVTTPAPTWDASAQPNQYGSIFGTRNANGVNDALLGTYGTNGCVRIGNTTSQAVAATFKKDQSRQQISLKGTTLTNADGTTKTVTRLNTNTSKIYQNMCVFALAQGARSTTTGGLTEPGSTRIYSLKFYDSNTLAVDLVGAIRKSDGMPGMYDKITKHFYPAPGLTYGNFTGNDLGDIPTLRDTFDTNVVNLVQNNTAPTRMITADAKMLDSLQDGQQINLTMLYTPVASVQATELADWTGPNDNASVVYLKLTLKDNSTTPWIPVFVTPTSRLTTHYGGGTTLTMTYLENRIHGVSTATNGSIVLRALVCGQYYDSNTYDRRLHNNVILAKTAIVGAHLVVSDGVGYYHIAAGASFNPAYTILYAGGAIAATKTSNNVYEAIPSVNFSTTGTIEAGAANKMLYLRCTASNGSLVVSTAPYLTTTPTAADSNNNTYIYIPVGIMVNATTGYFSASKDMYAFVNNEFIQVNPSTIIATHKLYYRTATLGTPTAPSSWITTNTTSTDNAYNTWNLSVPPVAQSTAENATKYAYLYSIEQHKRIDGKIVNGTISNDSNTTIIDGGSIITNSVTATQIDATNLHVSAANVDGTLTIGQMTGVQPSGDYATKAQAQGYANAKDTAIAAAAKRTYVSIRATAVDYSANTATLEATLYIDGTATTTGVTYVWMKDGTAISGATSRTYSVPASSGLNHAYSCKCTATV